MSKEVVHLCDFGQGSCRRPASSYRLWRDGDRQAWSVDLCDDHARPLLEAVEGASLVDLPTKQRQRMEVTKLLATPRTAPLKKLE
jgi:hypothetical protein